MNNIRKITWFFTALVLLGVNACNVQKPDANIEQNLGSISFGNSGSPEANEAFQRGVLALHNFWYPEALKSFKEASEIDSGLIAG